jgi:hypothetical protein
LRIQVLPAAYLFMVVAWIGSLYNAYYDMHQLWEVYLQKNYRATFFKAISKRLAKKTVVAAKKTGKKASVAGVCLRVCVRVCVCARAFV